MTTTQELREELAESIGLALQEHVEECLLCYAGEPCPDADELVVACLEWSPFPRDGEGCELGGEA